MPLREALVYPAGLPCPQVAPFSPDDLRLLSSSRPFLARALQIDRLALQTITFPPMPEAKAVILRDWGRVSLSDWGNKFASTWPRPMGRGGVRRFLGPPTAEYVPPGMWRFSGVCEVLGESEPPFRYISDCDIALAAAQLTLTEPTKVALWRGGEPPQTTIDVNQPILGQYHSKGFGPGSGDPTLQSFTIAWADLAEPPGVSVFGFTREGVWPGNSALVHIEVTDVPRSGVPICRACAMDGSSAWLGVDGSGEGITFGVSVNDITNGAFPVYLPPSALASFLIRNDKGTISVIDVANA